MLSLVAAVAMLLAGHPAGVNLQGRPADPLSGSAPATVFLFVRTDCPITNRYAPELARLNQEFEGRGVRFWLIYADHTETSESIQKHIAEYHFPGTPLRDPNRELAAVAHAKVAPECAVFDSAGRLMYHGRIDDRYVDFGKARASAQTHDLEEAISDVLAHKPVPQSETRAIGCSLADIQ